MFRTRKLPLQFRVMIYAMAMLFGTILLGGIFVASHKLNKQDNP
ncbi:hypothetical protein [Geomicrobium sp. JCM 19055]|nr:hypothetical protein [Geomicrobium sp. JCM 19055]